MVSRSTELRRNLKKKHPEKYRQYLNEQKRRAKERRDVLKKELKKSRPSKISKEKHEKIKEQARLRQQKFREKQAAEGYLQRTSNTKVTTRTAATTKKEIWREQKRRQRAKLSHQKAAAIRKKDRERKRAQVLARMKLTATAGGISNTGYKSKKSQYNAISVAKSHLPQNAQKYATVVTGLARNCSPRKRALLETSLVDSSSTAGANKTLFSPEAKEAILSIKGTSSGRRAVQSIAKKLVATAGRRLVRAELKVGFNPSKKKPKLKEHEETVRKLYMREDISRILPQKRYATKHGPGYLMQKSLLVTWQIFKAENPDVPMSYSKFAALRPRNVRLLTTKYREYCMCVYCLNIRYKVHALKPLMKDPAKKNMLTDEDSIVQILLCEKSDSERFHKKLCIDGACDNCKNYSARLRSFFSAEALSDSEVTWCTWKKRNDDGKVRRVPITRRAKVSQLLDELETDVIRPIINASFIQHLHNAHWQYRQFLALKETLPPGWILQVFDFAKNRSTFYEEEIKGAFFTPRQITMHPIVAYYRRSKGVVRHSVVVFSDDNLHDYHAVEHYSNMVLTHLQSQISNRILVNVIFSDGCSSQYKSAGPFADLSFKTLKTSRNFYGSEHGKGDCDGEIGVVNRALDRAICSKALVVNDGHDAFKWCQENLISDEDLSKREFLYVKNGEIKRDRPYTKAKTLPNTRKIHQLENIPSRPGYNLRTRTLSCFCPACRDMLMPVPEKSHGECRNKTMVDSFQNRKIKYHCPDSGDADSCAKDGPESTEARDEVDEILLNCGIDIHR